MPAMKQTDAKPSTSNVMPELPHPTPELISDYLKKWEKLEKYKLQEDALGLLFRDMCPENTKKEHIILKVCALNDFYSTNIYDTFTVAEHIQSLNIDSRLKNNDRTLVNDVALVKISGKTKNFYSFASKYCNHHTPETYPIYDYYVEKMLMEYKKRDKFMPFKKDDFKNYEHFLEIIENFRDFYGLASFTLRNIDVFLWQGGKEFFPRKYGKS